MKTSRITLIHTWLTNQFHKEVSTDGKPRKYITSMPKLYQHTPLPHNFHYMECTDIRTKFPSHQCLKACVFIYKHSSWNSAAGVITRLLAAQPCVWIPTGERDSSHIQNVQTDSGVQSASYSIGWCSFPGLIWTGSEVYHWPPSSVNVQNEYSYMSAPPICLHGLDRNIFTLLPFYITKARPCLSAHHLSSSIQNP
jgi:hypothetical protein